MLLPSLSDAICHSQHATVLYKHTETYAKGVTHNNRLTTNYSVMVS